jgi:thiol-disulfide isomerase/thioredoxin
MTTAALPLRAEGRIPALGGATGWLNSAPLTPESLRGHVVVVEFWTYTCINWLRTLPYVRAWADKYRDQGLVVLGVHTPEFTFERDVDNVRAAVESMRIGFPVALDSEYAVWQAFANHYWPALYFIDATGRIRHHVFGEGDYDVSERVIQQLLDEAGEVGDVVDQPLISVTADGLEAAADWADLRTGETYLGFDRGSGFSSPEPAADGARRYTVPSTLRPGHWALDGRWRAGDEAVVLDEAGGRIAFRFHARDLHLVMGPVTRGSSGRFRVLLDGRPPGAAHGADVDGSGNGVVDDQRLYQLIRQPLPVVDRTFEIEFSTPGVQALVFTFG